MKGISPSRDGGSLTLPGPTAAPSVADEFTVRRKADDLFVAHNRANGALYPYGFGFLSKADREPWMEKARIALKESA